MTLKKALVAITVVAMLFGMVSTAFAGGFTDISNADQAAAAARLNALSVLKGFPDGTFGPDQNITRAQFAAVAVRALGLDSAASYAQGATKFSDVAANHWASGYINIATQQGIISGYPDGTFGPEKNVTYAEALTMIVRLLGYGPLVNKSGLWPANYIAKAAQLGFTNGVSFNGADAATRGNVALFVDSSLSVHMMQATGVDGNGNPTYTVPNPAVTLLGDYLKATKGNGTLTSDSDLLGVSKATIGGTAYSVATGITVPAGLLGQNVDFWTNSDGKVFFVQSTEDASNIITGKISSYSAGVSITLTTPKTYSIAAGANVFANAQVGGTPAGEVTLVLDSTGKVKAITSFSYAAGVVSDVDVDGEIVTTTAGNSLNLSGTNADVRITKNGAAAAVKDIAADDVLNYFTDGAGNYVIIDTTKTATGTLSQVNADGTAVIGGTTYSKAASIVDSNGAATAFANFIGDNVNISLDKYGKVAYIDQVAGASSSYAVAKGDSWAVGTTTGTSYYVKLLKSDGTSTTLLEAAKVNGVSGQAHFAAGQVIKYTVDANGAMDTYTTVANANGAIALDTTNKLAGGKLVTSGTIIFDLRDTSNLATLSSSDFFNLTGVQGTVVADSTVTARAAVILVGVATGAATNPYAYVTAVYQDSNGWHATAFVGGNTVTYDVYDATVAGRVYVGSTYALNLSGTTIVAPETAASDVNAAVGSWDHNVAISFDSTNNILTYKAVDSNSAMLGTARYALFNSKTEFVDNTGDAPVISTSAAIKAGKTVELYDLNSDGIVDVVVVD